MSHNAQGVTVKHLGQSTRDVIAALADDVQLRRASRCCVTSSVLLRYVWRRGISAFEHKVLARYFLFSSTADNSTTECNVNAEE
jgi:hypothetical protein